MAQPPVMLYRCLLKQAKLYGEIASKRQLGSAKELSALCYRIGTNTEWLKRLESKDLSIYLQDELKKQFHLRAQETDPEVIQADIQRGFTALRTINERLNFLAILPDSTISNATTNYCNVQLESYFISVTANKRPRGQILGKDKQLYTFAYKVTISHVGQQDAPPFRLKSRRWIVTNENEDVDIVEGDGVVGKHPRLCAGEVFVYTSFCTLSTPLGVMKGKFALHEEEKGTLFEADINPIRLDVRCLPSKEQAEDIEATAQAHAIPVRYNSPATEKANE